MERRGTELTAIFRFYVAVKRVCWLKALPKKIIKRNKQEFLTTFVYVK